MKLAKSLNELGKRRWYRNLRFCFVLSFITAQVVVFVLVRDRTAGTVVAPISFRLVGGALQADMPAYRGMSDEEAGRIVYRQHPALWADAVEKYRKKHSVDPVTRYPEYSRAQRAQFFSIAILVITLFFEIARRAFYYIIFGKIFPRRRRSRRRKSEPESVESG
jgi:hypothetical protein